MKKIYILAAAAIALTACEKNDDNLSLSSTPARISASIGESSLSRASGTSWTPGDEIGISVSIANGALSLNNLQYATTDGSGLFTGTPIYFYNPMSFTAYYPFNGEEGSAPGILEARTAIENQKEDVQPQIDFLWDQQAGINVVDNKPEVHFTFGHKMSKVTLIFENGNDETKLSNIISYMIEGLVLEGTFNTETGVCAAKNQPAEDFKMDFDKGTVQNNVALPSLILFPQNPGNDKVKLHLYADELNDSEILQHYNCTLNFSNGELLPGRNYVYTITVTKTGVSVKNASIENWSETEVSGEASSDD